MKSTCGSGCAPDLRWGALSSFGPLLIASTIFIQISQRVIKLPSTTLPCVRMVQWMYRELTCPCSGVSVLNGYIWRRTQAKACMLQTLTAILISIVVGCRSLKLYLGRICALQRRPHVLCRRSARFSPLSR